MEIEEILEEHKIIDNYSNDFETVEFIELEKLDVVKHNLFIANLAYLLRNKGVYSSGLDKALAAKVTRLEAENTELKKMISEYENRKVIKLIAKLKGFYGRK